MAILSKDKAYEWKFSKIGGVTRVNIETGEDIAHLGELDQKMWTVLSCPTKGLEIDDKTLNIIDTDQDGKIKVRKDDLKTVYHDPCELGRGCGIYKEPRQILKTTTHLVKAKQEKEDSLCCGINLGDTVIDIEQQKVIRDAAVKNLLYKKPDLIATACPMCKKAFCNSTNLQVKDIAEIVQQNLIKK